MIRELPLDEDSIALRFQYQNLPLFPLVLSKIEISKGKIRKIEPHFNSKPLSAEPAEYIGVTVAVGLTALPDGDEASARVKADVLRRLYRLLHPLHGGQDGTGWPYGRSLRVHEVNSLLGSVRPKP